MTTTSVFCLTTIQIYTALKHNGEFSNTPRVWPPSRFTLLSNNGVRPKQGRPFGHHPDLHCSQTILRVLLFHSCLATIQIYTALKQVVEVEKPRRCLATIQIYTALKRSITPVAKSFVWPPSRFTLLSNDDVPQLFGRLSLATIQIYTALKPLENHGTLTLGLTTIQIYTALKPQIRQERKI